MKKTARKKIYRTLVIVGTVVAAWFVWYSVGLYRQKIETEARIGQGKVLGEINAENAGVLNYQGKTYERNPSVKAILFMGVDTSGTMEGKVSGNGGQADAVMVLAYNTANNTVKILMIPRDTMTPITLTDLSGNVLGTDRQHLTLAYAYGDGRHLSCERMSEAVSELLGALTIDGYISMNTDMISQLNDLVGGVPVTIEADGIEKRDPALTKGSTVTLSGKQAEIFVRFRDIDIDNSAIGRMSQQMQYMEAYMETVRKQAVKDDQTIVRIMDAIENHMITNMGKPQYMEIAVAVLNSKQTLTRKDMLVLPGEAVVAEFFDEFHHDAEGTQKMVLDLFYREQ